MTDEELNEVYTSLSGILSGLGLSWVVGQVNDEIQLGQVVTRTFRGNQPEQIELLDVGTKTSGGTIIGTDPYSALERVNLLVSAISVALTDCANFEQAVAQFFLQDPGAPAGGNLVSAPDREIPGEDAYVIAGRDVHSVTTYEHALSLLGELRQRAAQA